MMPAGSELAAGENQPGGMRKVQAPVPAPSAVLYVSAIFAERRRWAEASCGRWFILSARHGLVAPAGIRRAWSD
jgi:hypothetical protein